MNNQNENQRNNREENGNVIELEKPIKTFITVISNQPWFEKLDENGNKILEPQLKQIKYSVPGNSNLICDETISFPIIASLKGYVKKGDKIRIIALLDMKSNFVRKNYVTIFEPEVKKVLEEKGFKCNNLEKSSEYIQNLSREYEEFEKNKADSDHNSAPKEELNIVFKSKDLNDMDAVIEFVGIESELDEASNNDLFMRILDKIGNNEIVYSCITYGLKPITVLLFAAINYAYMVKKHVDVESMIYGQVDWDDKSRGRICELRPLFYNNVVLNRLAMIGEEDPVGFMNKMRSDDADE